MNKTQEQLQSQKLFKKICRKIGTTMRDHRMINEGDHVLVGLSGGKDSMILLEALAEFFHRAHVRHHLRLGPEDGRLRARLFELGRVVAEQVTNNGGWELDVVLTQRDFDRLLRHVGQNRIRPTKGNNRQF